MKFSLVKNSDIQRDLWNQCVTSSFYPLTYAYAWYLDCICLNWYGIVNENYSFVMPLCVESKLNKLRIKHPALAPKLGYFTKKLLTKTDTEEILSILNNNFVSIKQVLNKSNFFPNTELTKKTSCFIDLNIDYTAIYEGYSLYLKNILIKQDRFKDYVLVGILPNEVVSFLNNISFFDKEETYNRLRRVISYSISKRKIAIYSAFSKKNELIGVGIFIISTFTADLILLASLENNIDIKAMIADKFIQDNSNRTITLNFEVSEENSWSDFGAKVYYNYEMNYKKRRNIFSIFKAKK